MPLLASLRLVLNKFSIASFRDQSARTETTSDKSDISKTFFVQRDRPTLVILSKNEDSIEDKTHV